MKMIVKMGLLLLMPLICMTVPSPNDLPNKSVVRADCCSCKGILPQGTLNQVFLQTITPSDLTCYPYEITKPGTYVITRDFQQVVTQDGEPLIKILTNNVTIDFQTFSIYQNMNIDQINGTDPLLQSNFIEIGDGTNPLSNISIVNGTLRGAAGIGILINPEVSNVTVSSMRITNCLAGGIAMSGAQNVVIECCTITDNGSQNIIDDVTDLVIPLNGNLLDATSFPLAGSAHLGAFGVLAYNSSLLEIKDTEILSCGATDLENDAMGLYVENCTDVEVIRSAVSGHANASALTSLSPTPPVLDPPYLVARGMFFKGCTKGIIQSCLVNCNQGAGVVGIDVIESDNVTVSNSNIAHNHATGDWLHITLPVVCPDVADDFDLFTRDSLCDAFVDSGTNVNLVTAYGDYKTGLTLPFTSDTSSMTNWQMGNTVLGDPVYMDWMTHMDGLHTIDYALDYYAHRSRAYGIRLFDTNHVMIDSIAILETEALHNSAFGIFIDRNVATGTKGMNNIVKYSKIAGTRAFTDTTAPNVTYTEQIEALFGDILDETDGEAVRRYESISMIGRALGVEARNCTECTVLHNNLLKANSSDYTLGAGLFLNRANKTDMYGNRIECNYGSDIGYGLMNRIVDPSDLTACTTFFANGLLDRSNLIDPSGGPANPPFYPYGTDSYDKNINYGVFWSQGGILAIKHAFTSDLGLLDNIGTHQNIQIFFDIETKANLPCSISSPDVATAHIV